MNLLLYFCWRMLIVTWNSKTSIQNPQVLFLHSAHERWVRLHVSLDCIRPSLETLAQSCWDVIMSTLVEGKVLKLRGANVCCSSHPITMRRWLKASPARDWLTYIRSNRSMPNLTNSPLICSLCPRFTTLKFFEFVKFVSTREPWRWWLPYNRWLSFVTRIRSHSRLLLSSLYGSNVELFVYSWFLYPTVHYISLLANMWYLVPKRIFRFIIILSYFFW
jgi:hypothetical protein